MADDDLNWRPISIHAEDSDAASMCESLARIVERIRSGCTSSHSFQASAVSGRPNTLLILLDHSTRGRIEIPLYAGWPLAGDARERACDRHLVDANDLVVAIERIRSACMRATAPMSDPQRDEVLKQRHRVAAEASILIQQCGDPRIRQYEENDGSILVDLSDDENASPTYLVLDPDMTGDDMPARGLLAPENDAYLLARDTLHLVLETDGMRSESWIIDHDGPKDAIIEKSVTDPMELMRSMVAIERRRAFLLANDDQTSGTTSWRPGEGSCRKTG